MPHLINITLFQNTLVSSAHLRHSNPKLFNNKPALDFNEFKSLGVGTIVKKNSLDKQIFMPTEQVKSPLALQVGVVKPLVSKFYLILAYKKTLRTKINQYFNAPAANSFFCSYPHFIA
jgi:hypothetical protein